MRKRILSIVCLLAVLLLPLGAEAAPKLIGEFFPSGEIEAPKAPVLRYEGLSDNGDIIRMWYNVPEDVRTLAAAYNRWGNSDSGPEDFVARFGVQEYHLYLQTDARVDEGPWQYSEEWDRGWTESSEPHSLAFRCCEGLSNSPDKVYDNLEVSWLTYLEEGKEGFLAPAVVPYTMREEDRRNYHYDLENHTLAVRYRLALEYWETEGEPQCILSPWSPEVSIGQKGTQSPITVPDVVAAPVLSDFSVTVKNDRTGGKFYLEVPERFYEDMLYCEVGEELSEPFRIQVQTRKGGGEWQEARILNPTRMISGSRFTEPEGGMEAEEELEVRARFVCGKPALASPWSNTLGTAPAFIASEWARSELREASALGLIPGCLREADLTEPITRAEFAAVSVCCYEALTGRKAQPAASNPFTDTEDEEVLKAYAIGTTNGTGPETFSPERLLDREQAAAMMTRIYKKTSIDGWTLETDGDYAEDFRGRFEMPELFDDDGSISGWARDSVYFMKAKGIIGGVGGNRFVPNAAGEVSEGEARATREQAILIARRLVESFG